MNKLEELPEVPTQEVEVPQNLDEDDTQTTETQSIEAQAAEQDVHPMELLLSEDTFSFKELEVGETIEGSIVSISDGEVLVDIGSKSEGVIPSRDLDRVDDEIRDNLKVGETIFIQVVRPVSRDGHALLSLSRALAEYDWQHAAELMESQEVFEGEVSGFNKGGIIVYIGKARGFVPASQLVSDQGTKQDNSDDRFSALVGNKLQLKVIEIDRSRNRLILSERQAMRDWRRHQKEKLLSELQIGDVRTGTVSSLASFGAFVDLGGADGLIHLSELSWGRVQNPSEVIKVGDEVNVKIISVDRERRRIGLSLRQLLPEPWTIVHEQYAIGQLVESEITRLTSFGAFARVDGSIEGLVHISELSEQRINHPKEVVQDGQKLTLRVIKIDPDKRRMGLSLKRVAEEEYAVIEWAPDEADDTETTMAAAMAEAEEFVESDEGEIVLEEVEVTDEILVEDGEVVAEVIDEVITETLVEDGEVVAEVVDEIITETVLEDGEVVAEVIDEVIVETVIEDGEVVAEVIDEVIVETVIEDGEVVAEVIDEVIAEPVIEDRDVVAEAINDVIAETGTADADVAGD
ncbi:MAG: S1 RNA-binding domain-containing protein, partial [Chloroflexi bacterium]|nr:S1 RNA-binding domain-containing protein [Chloroflexota bacterium]